MHLGVSVLLEQVDVGLQGIVHFDFDAGFGFQEPGMMLPGLICKSNAEIVNVIETDLSASRRLTWLHKIISEVHSNFVLNAQ